MHKYIVIWFVSYTDVCPSLPLNTTLFWDRNEMELFVRLSVRPRPIRVSNKF